MPFGGGRRRNTGGMRSVRKSGGSISGGRKKKGGLSRGFKPAAGSRGRVRGFGRGRKFGR